MAANADRGEIEIHLGGQTRLLRFRSTETQLLEERLAKDVLAYIASGGGQTKFLAESVFCGLSGTAKADKHTPNQVRRWLDDEDDLDREDLQKRILYAIARGKNAAEAKRMVGVLDSVFSSVDDNETGPTLEP